MTQILEVADKDFKIITMTMLKNLFTEMEKMREQIENFIKEMETTKIMKEPRYKKCVHEIKKIH